MTKISDWYIPYSNKIKNWRDYLLYFLFFVYLIISYLIGYILADWLPNFFIIGAFMVLLGAIFNRAIFNRKFKKAAAILFLLGAGLILGIGIYSFNNPIFTIIVFISGASLIFIFIFLMKWVSKTQERLDIYVKGDYSIKLARKITSEIESILDYNKWPYRKYGCTYQMDFDDKERIIVGLRIDNKDNETEYKLVLRTNRDRDSARFLNIKKSITNLISNIGKNDGFDNYPQIEKIICKKCGKKAHYNSAHDKFYCHKCNKLKGDDEVLLTEKSLGIKRKVSPATK